MSILIFLIILLVLIVSHEFGHFIVAKKSGIRVDEFSFGFPPKLFGKKIGETSYNFNLLPVGGYVKIFGENPDEESLNGPDSKRSLTSKPWYIQAGVLIAGVTMNFLVAWLLFSIGFISGLPSSTSVTSDHSRISNQAVTITSVIPNSPAEKSGLKVGDKINYLETSSDSTLLLSSIFSPESVQNFIKKHDSEEINFSLIRGGEEKEISVTPEKISGNDNPIVGVSMDTIGILHLPLHEAVWSGLKLTSNLFVSTLVGFFNLIYSALTGSGSMSALTGPVGIVGVVSDATQFGFIYLLSFTAMISVNLAVINLIPFPALDGGRLLFLLIEKIKGSRIKPEIANTLNFIGFGILMILMVFITYNDVVKLL